MNAIVRILPATIGALIGSMISLAFFLLMKMNIGGEGPEAISSFLIFAISLLSSLSSNILATTLLYFTNRDRFSGDFRRAMSHIFFITIGLFSSCSIFFFLLSTEKAFLLSAFLLPFSALATALLYEIFMNPKNAVLAAHKAIFGGLFVAAIFSLFFPIPIPYTMMLFIGLPLAWFILPAVAVVVEIIWDKVEKQTSP